MLGDALKFLAEHFDLIELLYKAISGGVSKDEVMSDIKARMVKASDDEMAREFPT